LRNTTIFLFNRTNKVIVAGSLIALFPQTGDGKTKPYRGCGMYFGRRPDVDSIDGRTGKPIAQDPSRTPLSWQPGQYLEVHVGDYIDGIQVRLKPAMALKDVNWLRIHIGAFFFEDGMRWMGTFAVPDPDRPGKFKNMPDDYYPGNRYINWPPRERN